MNFHEFSISSSHVCTRWIPGSSIFKVAISSFFYFHVFSSPQTCSIQNFSSTPSVSSTWQTFQQNLAAEKQDFFCGKQEFSGFFQKQLLFSGTFGRLIFKKSYRRIHQNVVTTQKHTYFCFAEKEKRNDEKPLIHEMIGNRNVFRGKINFGVKNGQVYRSAKSQTFDNVLCTRKRVLPFKAEDSNVSKDSRRCFCVIIRKNHSRCI